MWENDFSNECVVCFFGVGVVGVGVWGDVVILDVVFFEEGGFCVICDLLLMFFGLF